MNRLSRDQAAVIGAFTGILAGPFNDMHGYIEKILGRPVYTHELASKSLSEEIKEKSRVDFLAIAAEEQIDE